MSFLSLVTVLAVGVLVASLITNFLKGIILVLSGIGLCFYLFFATTAQKTMLDDYAKTVSFTEIPNMQDTDYAQKLDSIVSEGTKIIETKAQEIAKQIEAKAK